MDKETITIIISVITLLVTIGTAGYKYGCHNKEAQKDKEMTEMQLMHNKEIRDLDYKHRTELNAMEKERDEWKEKYFILLNSSKQPANNSP